MMDLANSYGGRAYLLTRVPEPETLPLLAGGLAGLLALVKVVRRARTQPR